MVELHKRFSALSRGGTLRKQYTLSPNINWSQQSGTVVLSFYTCLVRLLACCASSPRAYGQAMPTSSGSHSPSAKRKQQQPSVISEGDGLPSSSSAAAATLHAPPRARQSSANRQKLCMISRTRDILQNLIKAEEIVAILSFPSSEKEKGLTPFHKEAALLFFARVYGIPGPDLLLELLNKAFAPDIKLALRLSSVSF